MIRPVLGGCWGEARVSRACGLRAISNGMVTPTLGLWRPVLVHSRTPCVVFFELCTKQIMNLQCGASAPLGAVTLCADVACLEWAWRMRGQAVYAPAGATAALCSLKPWLQKRLKKWTDCSGKHLGCSKEASKGLQCGLSGNRVARMGNAAPWR